MKTPSQIFVDHEKILLNKEGIFISNGEEISHVRTAEAFHRFIGHDDEGYFIQIGQDFKRIEVEDTAYFVQAIEWKNGSATGVAAIGAEVYLRLSDGSVETLDPETLNYADERLTCRVKKGKEEAKFLRVPYLEFFLHALENEGDYSIRLGGKNYPLQARPVSN